MFLNLRDVGRSGKMGGRSQFMGLLDSGTSRLRSGLMVRVDGT